MEECNMNNKAEQFNSFLEEQKIKVFQMEELEGNEQHTVVFRSFLGVEGQQLPTIVIIDDSIFSIIRMMYKPFKLFFDERGDLMLDVCLVTDKDKLDGNEVYQLFSVIINYLDENYRNIMKVVWR